MRLRRLAPRVVLALSITSLLASPVLPNYLTRDWVRCHQTCTYFDRIGADRCDADCTALFPGDQAAISACWTECNAAVEDLTKECVYLCKFLKTGAEPPEEP